MQSTCNQWCFIKTYIKKVYLQLIHEYGSGQALVRASNKVNGIELAFDKV